MDEEPGEMMQSRRSRRRGISYQRRVELLRYAEQVAADVQKNVQEHERCLFRRMVEHLLPEDEC